MSWMQRRRTKAGITLMEPRMPRPTASSAIQRVVYAALIGNLLVAVTKFVADNALMLTAVCRSVSSAPCPICCNCNLLPRNCADPGQFRAISSPYEMVANTAISAAHVRPTAR